MNPNMRTHLLPERDSALEQDAIAFLRAGSHRDEKTGCLVWYAPRDHKGYGRTRYGGEWWQAHRLSYAAHRGPIPIGLFVCHKCDNPSCIEIEHLFLGTPQENFDDAIRKGRMRWATPRLNPSIVAEMKRRLCLGHAPSRIAREMGLAIHSVAAVKARRSWQHILPATEEGPWQPQSVRPGDRLRPPSPNLDGAAESAPGCNAGAIGRAR
jgi:hypothetical protein